MDRISLIAVLNFSDVCSFGSRAQNGLEPARMASLPVSTPAQVRKSANYQFSIAFLTG
jgi:hypothetical protein